jgi:hypothetical protein
MNETKIEPPNVKFTPPPGAASVVSTPPVSVPPPGVIAAEAPITVGSVTDKCEKLRSIKDDEIIKECKDRDGYKKMSKQIHPDKNPGCETLANNKFSLCLDTKTIPLVFISNR